jgi:molybdate transport system ATP-binding protein
MTIEVDVDHRLGDFRLALAFTSDGPLTALFGPSGSGKSSLINVIAGLIRPDRGRVIVGETVLNDAERGIFVAKHRRRVGYVFQEGRLFPHLSVRRNLLYGRWFVPRRERYTAVAAIIDLLGIGPLLDRDPEGLSGGEKQRVAIGRALLASPRLLLMDEPLASLDEERKAEILPYIERLRDDLRIPIVYVSHSLAEVSRLATTVVALSAGRMVACGPAIEVLNRHDLLPGGSNVGTLLEAEVVAHDGFGLTSLRTGAGDLLIPRVKLPAGATTRVRIRPEDVLLATAEPIGMSALNTFAGTIVAVEAFDGSTADIAVACRGQRLRARVTQRSVEQLSLAPGLAVFAIIKAVALDPVWLGAFGPGEPTTSAGPPVETSGIASVR